MPRQKRVAAASRLWLRTRSPITMRHLVVRMTKIGRLDSGDYSYEFGVVPVFLSAIIKAAMPGDKVIVQAPPGCLSSIRNDYASCFVNNLIYQAIYIIDLPILCVGSSSEQNPPVAAILTIRSPGLDSEELQHSRATLRMRCLSCDEIIEETTTEDMTDLALSERCFCKIPSLAFRRARRSTLPGCKSPISSQPMKRCAAVLTEPSISTRYATSIRSA